MRILFICHELPPIGGGGGNACYHFARAVSRLGHHSDIVTSRYQGLSDEKGPPRIYRVSSLRYHKSHANMLEMFGFCIGSLIRCNAIMNRQKHDVIHCFFTLPAGLVGAILKKMYQVPLIIRLGGSDVPGFNPHKFGLTYRLLKPLYRIIWKNTDLLVVNSSGLKRMLSASTDRPIKVIPNGIDLNEFRPDASSGWKRRRNKVICVSRLEKRKGLDYLVLAMKRLPDHSLQIVGDGPDAARIKGIVAQNHLANVKFVGNIPHSKLPDYLTGASVFVLPSLAEGMPNVVLEAMACGLPIVMTDVGGSHELIRQGPAGNGFTVPKKDSKAIAEKLGYLSINWQLAVKMGSQSRQIVERSFSWHKLARQYIKEYKGVIK